MRPDWNFLLERDDMPRGLWPVEWLTIAYCAITSILLIAQWPLLHHPETMVVQRATIVLCTMAVWGFYTLQPMRMVTFARITMQMGLLAYWYPETYEFNCTFANLDHVFAGLDASLFDCQPSIVFSQLCPWDWFSEALNMGYFAYYPMIALVMFYYFFRCNAHYERASFVVMCSFFIYYLIYIMVPVAGPQFYFVAVDPADVAAARFPELGTYFAQHTEMLTAPGNADGLFYGLVHSAQEAGERPTAAFPSSHIGITFILLYLTFPRSRKLFAVLLPIALLLTLATVYIQAHYLVDAIAGVLSSVVVYLASDHLFSRIVARRHA